MPLGGLFECSIGEIRLESLRRPWHWVLSSRRIRAEFPEEVAMARNWGKIGPAKWPWFSIFDHIWTFYLGCDSLTTNFCGSITFIHAQLLVKDEAERGDTWRQRSPEHFVLRYQSLFKHIYIFTSLVKQFVTPGFWWFLPSMLHYDPFWSTV